MKQHTSDWTAPYLAPRRKISIPWPLVREVISIVFTLFLVSLFFYMALVFCSVLEPGVAPQIHP